MNTLSPTETGEPHFTWIPFYEEFADKLRTFRDKREELLKIVYGLEELSPKTKGCKGFVDYLHDKQDEQTLRYTDIDPFSILAIFNRHHAQKTETRLVIARYFQKQLAITADLPTDWKGISIPFNQRAVFSRGWTTSEIDSAWSLLDAVFDGNPDFSQHFDCVARKIGWETGLVLYWVHPDTYMPLNRKIASCLENAGISPPPDRANSGFNAEHYLKWLDEIKNSAVLGIQGLRFPEITYRILQEKEPSMSQQTESPVYQTQQRMLIDKCVDLLKLRKNLILQGAPGTGKTYSTAAIALEILGVKDVDLNDHAAVMKRYSKLQEDKQIFFTTFHPSMEYEDFVEGLKPVLRKESASDGKNGQQHLDYEVKLGIFREACQAAKEVVLRDSVSELKNMGEIPAIWKISLGGTGDTEIRKDCLDNGYIRIGWKEYGDVNFDTLENVSKSKTAPLRAFQSKMKNGDIVVSCYSETKTDAIGIVAGDYVYDAAGGDFPRYRKVKWIVKGIKEDIFRINNDTKMTLSTVYRLKIKLDDILSLIQKHLKVQRSITKNVVLIIDEINRGNVSKIFGELVTVLEADKRSDGNYTDETSLRGKHPIHPILPYSRTELHVPSNVYIIGTMNTTDRSTDTLDYAVRRRFAFVTLPADETVVQGELAKALFRDVKTFIEHFKAEDLDIDDLMVGHSYFLVDEEPDSAAYRKTLQLKMEFEVIPLLQEYARDGILIDKPNEKMAKYFEAWKQLKTRAQYKTEKSLTQTSTATLTEQTDDE